MELKTKYQYTYFIHPYIIDESKINKYLLKLLKDNNIELRVFKKEKDLGIYNYFVPTIRKYMFPSFEYEYDKIREFEKLDNNIKAAIISKNECNIFEYEIPNFIQGKIDEKNGIFFNIQKIEIVCFKTGICFLNIKTTLENSEKFEDVLNFNYKFNDLGLEESNTKGFENIKIQSNNFDNMKDIGELLTDIMGMKISEDNLDTNRFYIYSYSCIDQDAWNDKKEFKDIEHEFIKYTNNMQSNSNITMEIDSLNVLNNFKYSKFGFSNIGCTLITSSINTENYTKLPFKYENELLYMYIFMLYKKMLLKRMSRDIKNNSKNNLIRKTFLDFSKKLWIQETTNDILGNLISKQLEKTLNLKELYDEVKDKYDIIFKELKIEKNQKTSKILGIILVASLIINIINFILIFGSN